MADGHGLSLKVMPNGTKGWRFRYFFEGREKMLSLGAFPDVSLAEAREKRDAARKLLAQEPPVDPSAARKAEKAARGHAFGAVARRWFKEHATQIAESTRIRDERILNKLTAQLEHRPIGVLETPELLAVLRSIEHCGTYETTHRALGMMRRTYALALAEGLITRDPTAGLREQLKPVQEKSRPAITDPADLGRMLVKIDAYDSPVVRAALQLLALTLVRPGDLRKARWQDIDLDAGEWTIPKERMKMRRQKERPDHTIPLSRQALAILTDLRDSTGGDDRVFPSARPGRCISENTMSVALKSLGISGDKHVPHGFRATARTLLDEVLEYRPDWIEHQLAHTVRDPNGRAYNRTTYLRQRREMLQAWSDYLDELRVIVA